MNETYGLSGAGCDVEFDVLRENKTEMFLCDAEGRKFWLKTKYIDDDGVLTPDGVEIYKNIKGE